VDGARCWGSWGWSRRGKPHRWVEPGGLYTAWLTADLSQLRVIGDAARNARWVKPSSTRWCTAGGATGRAPSSSWPRGIEPFRHDGYSCDFFTDFWLACLLPRSPRTHLDTPFWTPFPNFTPSA